jgi:ribosome-binding factor A
MKEFDRTERLGAEFRRELALLVRDEVRDPRLANITIQEVRVARDLAHAKVFFTCFPGAGEGGEEPAAQERLLNGRLSGFLRHGLAQRVSRVRAMPQLHFVYDESIQSGERLAALIEGAVSGLDAESAGYSAAEQAADAEVDEDADPDRDPEGLPQSRT